MAIAQRCFGLEKIWLLSGGGGGGLALNGQMLLNKLKVGCPEWPLIHFWLCFFKEIGNVMKKKYCKGCFAPAFEVTIVLKFKEIHIVPVDTP